MINHQLIAAKTQRFIAIENAFKTIDAFAIPSMPPDLLDKYEEAKKYLIDVYNVPESDIENYKFK